VSIGGFSSFLDMKRAPLIILIICAAGFAFGLFELFKLRFELGDVYPEYSSLRSDPLGTMALCESLEQIPGLTVTRDFSNNNRLPEEPRTTYLHLAASSWEWQSLPPELFQEIESFMTRGGRLAITFLPETTHSFFPGPFIPPTPPATTNKTTKAGKQSPQSAKKKAIRKSLNLPDEPSQISLKEKWGLDYNFVPLPPSDTPAAKPAQAINQTDLPLPEALDWHTGVVFTNLNNAWQTIYARSNSPVVIERHFGPGSMVIATDSYFVSNEALRKYRHADLLAWLVGPARRVVFDESHFGIVEQPGVSTLVRKYRLYGLAAGLVLLAALFIWKNALSFVPPWPEEKPQDFVAGKDAAAGFVNLLRRNVPARDLLNVCFAEWTKSLGHGTPHLIARVDQAQAVLEAENARPPRDRQPLRAYQQICQILKGKKPTEK
jgi:hypothetical protein